PQGSRAPWLSEGVVHVVRAPLTVERSVQDIERSLAAVSNGQLDDVRPLAQALRERSRGVARGENALEASRTRERACARHRSPQSARTAAPPRGPPPGRHPA